MKELMDMKRAGAASVLILLVLWLGYCIGYRNGVQQERQAWLATEQHLTLATGAGVFQGWDTPDSRTYYSYPHSGRTFFASFGSPPVNVPDPRNSPVK